MVLGKFPKGLLDDVCNRIFSKMGDYCSEKYFDKPDDEAMNAILRTS